MVTSVARGVLYVHSSPRALCPHVEWAAGHAIGRPVNFEWTDQPVLRGAQRADFYWEGAPGTGAAIASKLRGWEHLRFEVTEDPRDGVDGSRWLHTPDLGIFHAQTDAAGNIVVPEDRIRAAMDAAGTSHRAAPRAPPRPRAGVGRRARAVPARHRHRLGHLAPPLRGLTQPPTRPARTRA